MNDHPITSIPSSNEPAVTSPQVTDKSVVGTTETNNAAQQSEAPIEAVNNLMSNSSDPSTSTSGLESAGTPASEAIAAIGNETLEGSTPLEVSPWFDGYQQVSELLQIGGPVVWILAGLSVISLTLILLKLWQLALLRPEKVNSLRPSLELWRQGNTAKAVSTLSPKHSVESLVLHAMQGIIAGAKPADLQEELSRRATGLISQLHSFLRPLEVIANLSPLLGLMGTVLGMIVAFQQMEAAGSQVDPSVLSGGIWQALLTTAAGLAVAIPVSAAHSWLERKIERVSHLINDSVTQVFTQSTLPVAQANTPQRSVENRAA